jgi:hypothetical protein
MYQSKDNKDKDKDKDKNKGHYPHRIYKHIP